MPKVKIYNSQGKPAGEVNLEPKIFNVKIKPELVQQAVRTQLANKRVAIAHTKDRSEVRGGGRKPWRQKGTGRARHGSTRSPIWSGGGVTFGPRN
ncbi:50S ribosomal protein L4, partial [Patescibacteria group bacterium]|nr:50S ribosomal protein L4 [Patescibacteria group bacterium]